MKKIDESSVEALRDAAEIVNDLHEHLRGKNKFPHPGQFPMIRAFFNDGKKIIHGQCGRSFGKTEINLYITNRFALTHPNTMTYIICPEKEQGKAIYWQPRRLQTYAPSKYIQETMNSELRVVFKNGSSIIVEGCKNYEALRGIKPHLVVYDEFQHHSHLFDEEIMQPNLSSGNVSLIITGTPPRRTCYYVDFRKNLLKNIKAGDTDCFYIELPSEANLSLDRAWLAKKKKQLISEGKESVWLREYEGKLVFDKEHAILPFFSTGKHVFPRQHLMDLIRRDRHKMDWYCLFDPGTASCFAALLIGVNPYTAQTFVLDEIYATEKREMVASSIWELANAKKRAIYPELDEWQNIYDEAAVWFANEIQMIYGGALTPTRKFRSNISRLEHEGRAGESLINSLMLAQNKFFVSSQCEKFQWEIENYVTDEEGKYPKKHDHLMDLLIYFAQSCNIDLNEQVDNHADEEEGLRAQSLSDFVSKMNKDDDLGVEPEYFDMEPDSWT